jgi:methionyl aminopeptidase
MRPFCPFCLSSLFSLLLPSIQTFTPAQIESFRAGGMILRACLEMLRERAVSGVTTAELDHAAEAFIREKGGTPAFKGYGGFPATLCTSINEECVHGIPGPRALREGDIIAIDCGVRLEGLVTDACISVPVGRVSAEAQHVIEVAEAALARAVDTLRAGIRVGDLSAAIEKAVRAGGCTVIKSLTGHGLGESVHHYPDIPNHGRRGTGPVLPAGTVIAVEPIVSLGDDDVRLQADGWTLVTAGGSLCAHAEHTLLVLEEGCEILA